MKTFKAALFDLDGTLFDTEGQYSIYWQKIGLKYHPEIPDFANIIKGTTLTSILDKYFAEPSLKAMIIESLDQWEQQMRYQYFPGAEAFLADLRRHNVELAVVTSSNQQKMANVKRQLPDFEATFDHILTAEDFAFSKPNPDCYLKGASACGCTPSECVVFEDAFSGLAAGMAANIFTFGLATSNSRESIQDKCDYVLDNYLGLTYEKINDII